MWGEDDEEAVPGGVKEGFRSKPRFSYTEVKMLLDEVKKNRHILLKKFNRGVSVDTKKQKWSEITDQINALGENHRETRQIMKKWADLKCDGKRRLLALRGPNGPNLRKKRLGPVERMVHRILMMSPTRDGGADQDLSPAEDFPRSFQMGPVLKPPPYSYLSLNDNAESNPEGFSFDMSPLSSPENEPDELIHSSSEFDQAEDEAPSSQDLLPRDIRQRIRPVFTYSRTHQNQNHTSSPPAASSSSCAAPPPPSESPKGSSLTPSLLLAPSSSTSAASIGAPPPPPTANSSSSLPPPRPPPSSSSNLPGSPSVLPPLSSQDQVTQLASQSLQQQRAGRMLLTSVSRSLEMLAQSVQLLVESQQEFVQESLQLQRETLDVLRDFSNTALRMLRDKNSGQPLPHPPPPPPGYHHQHPASRF